MRYVSLIPVDGKRNLRFQDVTQVTLKELKEERCPRISPQDVVDLIHTSPDKVVVIDIRNTVQ